MNAAQRCSQESARTRRMTNPVEAARRIEKLRSMEVEADWGDKFYAAVEALEQILTGRVVARSTAPHVVMAGLIEDVWYRAAGPRPEGVSLDDAYQSGLLDGEGTIREQFDLVPKDVNAYMEEGEHCQVCGRPYPLGGWWQAPDDLWLLVTGTEHGLWCPDCFGRAAEARGLTLVWSVTAYDPDSEERT